MANPEKLNRRKFLRRGALLAAGGFGAYAYGIEPRWISIERHQLPVNGLPESLDGSVAVQISDIHVGSRVNDEYILKQFEFVDSLKPEFVFFTGDYLDNGSKWHLEKGLSLLDRFPRGSIGNVSVLGNHDFGSTFAQVIANADHTRELVRQFNAAGLNMLREETVDLGGLKVAGLNDLWLGDFKKSASRSVIAEVAQHPSIVLSHNPDAVDLPIWDGYQNWILCGHTHGGQCTFPLIGAPICPVENRTYVSGFYDIEGGHRLYINRGVGHTMRVRFMARPEITIFTLKRA